MLFLLFQLGKDRYALEAARVVEVVPLLDVKTVPQALPPGGAEIGAPGRGVAGMIVYRGRPIPVLDLCAMTTGRPAAERLSTRIIILETESRAEQNAETLKTDSGENAAEEKAESRKQKSDSPSGRTTFPISAFPQRPGASRWIGLIAERATELLRREARDFVAAVPGGGPAATPSLGPVLVDDKGVIQWLQAPALLKEAVGQQMNPT